VLLLMNARWTDDERSPLGDEGKRKKNQEGKEDVSLQGDHF
jgi:hypothetical protein